MYTCVRAVMTYWLEYSMAERSPVDPTEGMMPNEMLTVLQSEMDSIRVDQQALIDEINDIKAQFCNLIHSCGFDDTGLSLAKSLVTSPKCVTPRNVVPTSYRSLGQDSPEETPRPPAKGGCSYGDKLIQMMLEMPSSYLDDSELSESPPGQRSGNAMYAQGMESSPTEPGQSRDNVPTHHIPTHERSRKQLCQPMKLNFDAETNCTMGKSNMDMSFMQEIFDSEQLLNSDSVRFNPASILNSTSISALGVFASDTPSVNYTSYNPSSRLDCTPAVINPASRLDYTPAVINPASRLDCTPAVTNPALNLDCTPAVINPVSTLSYMTAMNNPVSASNFKRTVNNLISAPSCTPAVDNPESSFNSTIAVTCSNSASITISAVVASVPEMSRLSMVNSVPALNNLSECADSTLNFTSAMQSTSYNPHVLYSTSEVPHATTHYMNSLNPKYSAIVNYSLSSTESDQSAVVPEDRSAGVGDVSILPTIDYQEEIMSRMKYYSDFTIDRQRKINKMKTKLNMTPSPEYGIISPDVVPDDIFTRHVEGAEDRSHQVCLIGQPASRFSSVGSSAGGSSTQQKTSVSQHKDSSSTNNTSDRVLKSMENTRRLQRVPSNLTSTRRSARASSTTSGNSTSPSTSSVYAWSMQNSNDGSEDKSSRNSHSRRSHRRDKRPRSSRNSVHSHPSSHSSSRNALNCRDHDIHTMLGQPCHQVMKYLPIPQYYNNFILSNDSLYDDGYKSQTLPQSSTKKSSLNPASSINSSLEAKRNSVADIRTVTTPPHSEQHISSGSDSLSSKYPPGRPGCIGMSTTSSGGSPTGTDSSVPRSSRDPTSSLSTEAENNAAQTALTDSILTDSPNSVSSSGIFAPCNSPDATLNSRISCSSIGDSQSIDLRGISAIYSNTTTLSRLSVINPTSISSSQFKVPAAPPPKKSSRRRGGDRCSTPDVRTSTPKPQSYPNSVQSNQESRRKLFSSSSSTYSSHGSSSSSRLMDKKSVIKKFRKFSENFYKTKSSRLQIETLANL